MNSRSFSDGFNATNVVLILKKDNPVNIKDFRPISLYNVIYKIIAKVLANRLKKLLPTIISKEESAFIPGRSIIDNIVIAFKIIYCIRRITRGVSGEVAFKVDISKANDHIKWSYL